VTAICSAPPAVKINLESVCQGPPSADMNALIDELVRIPPGTATDAGLVGGLSARLVSGLCGS
jgi:hypothetical protein